jgi:YbgC/YbaW family acyl-CoA thioester hydrolase
MTCLFRQHRQVRFQDIDAAGILFFARVFEYFHDAFAALLAARGVDLPKVIREESWGAPLGHAEADFKAPMRFGDAVTVEVERGEVGTTSLTVLFRIVAAADPSKVLCTGKAVHVFVDRETFRSVPVPAEMRAIFAPAGSSVQ